MISEKSAKLFCKDNVNMIENYEEAINDKDNFWVIHHRLEVTINGDFAHTPKELKKLNMYYNRPYFELIFMKLGDHSKFHNNFPRTKRSSDKYRSLLCKNDPSMCLFVDNTTKMMLKRVKNTMTGQQFHKYLNELIGKWFDLNNKNIWQNIRMNMCRIDDKLDEKYTIEDCKKHIFSYFSNENIFLIKISKK